MNVFYAGKMYALREKEVRRLDDVLLLRDMQWQDCHIKDCLQISGYRVMEMDLDNLKGLEHRLAHKDIVVIVCEYAVKYLETCARIRVRTQLPIIVVTRSDDAWVQVKMFRIGMDDYIAEPYQEIVLLAVIQARIEQYRRLTKFLGDIEVRDLVIETINRRVCIRGEEIDLSVKEFDILLYLVRNGNTAVSKEELYEEVWKEKACSGAGSSIATYMKKLRKKIEVDPDNPQYLETVWGLGYRFVM